jgi:SAM-dependent methyltransferase
MLRCPLQGGRLTLHPIEITEHPLSEADAQEAKRRGIDVESVNKAVKNGILISEEAKVWYPIVNYVPVMLDFKTKLHGWFANEHKDFLAKFPGYTPPTGEPRPGELLTQKSFSTQWNLLQDDELTFVYTHKERDEFIKIELDWPNWVLNQPDSKVINVGCGFGMESLSLRSVTGAEVFGTDLNLSLLTSGPKFASQPFVHTAIASLFALPYEHKTFDIVYSHGVLHHTFSTKKAVNSIRPLMKDNGMIYIWLYALEDFATNVRMQISAIFEVLFRSKISKLPTFLQNIVVHLFAIEYHIRQKSKGYNRDKWKYKNSLHMVRDRWTCRYAYRHSFHEVMCWFTDQGYEYKLVDSAAYKRLFGFPLIGIGIRCVKQPMAAEMRKAA